MLNRSSWLHLRIPFSYFLLPVFLFALSVSPNLDGKRVFWTFFILHFLLYPASNGYNSYFDKDEESIGGLRNPPPVTAGLYYLSLLFDFMAVLLGYIFLSGIVALMMLVYGLVSKAYSHPQIRLKKYAITGWIIAGVFQGWFTFLMCYAAINGFGLMPLLNMHVIVPGLLTTIMLWGNYPMTQVYQHREDARRGDRTLSLKLGITGTFYFTAVFFALAVGGFGYFFLTWHSGRYMVFFLMFLAPVLIYFVCWFIMVKRNSQLADYSHTMWLNFISSTCLNAFFIFFFMDASHVLSI